MEERVKKFHIDAAAFLASQPRLPAKIAKEMKSLQKFIHKNQDYRFSGKEKAKLFGAVETYFSMLDRGADIYNQPGKGMHTGVHLACMGNGTRFATAGRHINPGKKGHDYEWGDDDEE
ncbi:hypothetical protein BDK51DRAFT_30930 [Blyttiomyces helicus]|uniref:Uncharacterized protein n=1 Tax=Blyttiomyces helicus TaxID=388810 RepID=A0A4V1IRW2_9FUNG|nr:hypothetical protein BDK51DRAFT_30930 [Blyttiomyces helicus]|eukprot:RKO91447.1 hypothetical protein BDK51DRAFT_30930 [Blyttiomyces helicus]